MAARPGALRGWKNWQNPMRLRLWRELLLKPNFVLPETISAVAACKTAKMLHNVTVSGYFAG